MLASPTRSYAVDVCVCRGLWLDEAVIGIGRTHTRRFIFAMYFSVVTGNVPTAQHDKLLVPLQNCTALRP